MKKGSLNFLGRKNPSLFDTNVKMKEMDNVELVLGSSATPESGTASVRARPTVKHYTSSSDSFQAFAVPTPKVPLLPPVNGPKTNGSVGGDLLSNGSVTSVPNLDKGEIFVPPPPSVAPPPPPSVWIPPPPDFLGDINTLQPPSMPAPNPPSVESKDLSFPKPPPMAPPKPPSTTSTGSASSIPISSPTSAQVPEHPKFAAPQPPTERQQKTQKKPPPKPIRISSVSNSDSPPQTPAPPPPVQTPTLSTFNPQNKPKVYTAPKTSFFNVLEDRDNKPKHMLLLEDSVSSSSVPVLVQVDGNAPKAPTLSKPVPNDVKELKENLQVAQPSESTPFEQKIVTKTETKAEAKKETISLQPEKNNTVQPPPQKSLQLDKVDSTVINLEPSKDKLEENQSPKAESPKGETSREYQSPAPVKPGRYHNSNQKFSPILDHKLRSLKGSETHGARDGHAASPLALLKAAKEREKHRTTHSLSRENSGKNNEQSSIHSSDLPSSGSLAVKSTEKILPETPKSFSPVDRPQTNDARETSSSHALVNGQAPSTSPALSRIIETRTVSKKAEERQNAYQSSSLSQTPQPEGNKDGFSMPLLPPPPEFDDLNKIMDQPPSIIPPDPPTKKAPSLPVTSLSPASVQYPLNKTQPSASPPSSVPPPPLKTAPPTSVPPPPLKTAPPASVPPPPLKTAPPASVPPPPPLKTAPTVSVPPPPLNPPPPNVQPKAQVQVKPKPDSTQPARTLEQRHFDLQCILKKKLEEMAPKMSHQKEDIEPSSDEWEANDQLKSPTTKYHEKAATLDMRELQRKVDKKYPDNSVFTSNGPKSKYQHGMTFTVRPGTKNPITYHE